MVIIFIWQPTQLQQGLPSKHWISNSVRVQKATLQLEAQS